MKFVTLEMWNFLTIKSGRINLDDRGLNVIQGANEDDSSAHSNGAGKSSVVDALCWALYGVTARGAKGDAVVNLQAKKDCMVQVHLHVGDNLYRVCRYRKDKTHKNALHLHVRPFDDPGMVATDLTKGTDAETQKEVERVVGCSVDVFLAAIYSGQEIMPDLPKMTDRELKRLIEEAAGLERIERAYEEARTRKSKKVAELDTISLQIENTKTRIARDEARLEVKRHEAEQFEDERAVRVVRAVEEERELIESCVQAARKVREQMPIAEKAKAEIATLNEQLENHSRLEKIARDAETAATKAEASIGRALLVEARSAVAAIQAQIENVDEAMSEPCEECGKAHTEDDRHLYLAHRVKRLEDAKENLKLVEQRVREQIMEVNFLKEAAVTARENVPDVSEASRRKDLLTAEITKLNHAINHAKLQKEHRDSAAARRVMRETEPNAAQAVADSLAESVASEATKLGWEQTKKDALIKQVELADSVVKVFGPAGVRAQILDTVTPFLNDRTSDYLSVLSDGAITARWTTLTRAASGDLKEKFSIDVSNSKGGDSFLLLSGGEKRKVRLATALALQDLVASRATQPIQLFIGDEIDDALDPAGLERLMIILERRARERGTVLVISHNSLSDWCDAVTTVTKKGGVSYVKGSLCE